jgi:hypothetical protein
MTYPVLLAPPRGRVAADPLADFEVDTSPSALVVALRCRVCCGVYTISRSASRPDWDVPLTLAELVEVARGHLSDPEPHELTAG